MAQSLCRRLEHRPYHRVVRGASRTRDQAIRLPVIAALTVALSACGANVDTADTSASTSAQTSTSTGSSTTTPTSTTTEPVTTTTPTTVPTTTSAPGTTVAPATAPPTTSIAPTTLVPATTAPPTITLPSTGRSTAVYRLPTTSKVIALTFDAGSDVGYTNMVLDTLSAKGVQASFGITGEFAQDHPAQVRRMAGEGHVVMNHSQSHFSFTGASTSNVLLTTDERQADLRQADAVLAPLVGSSTIPYWRPPFGDYDASVLDDVGAIGYARTVMWTFDSLGWRGLTVDQIVARVHELAQPGAIIVMHVGSQSEDGPALERVIDELRSMGYSFTTIANALPT